MGYRVVRAKAALCSALLSLAASSSEAATPIFPDIDGRSIVLVRRPDPGFEFVTSSGALSGAAAALGPLHDMHGRNEIQSAGRQLAAEDRIDDPAISLSTELLSGLVDTYKLRWVDSNAIVVADDNQLEAYRKQNQPDLIFELYTQSWRTFYFLDFKHYDVWYYAKARLIDGRTGSVIRRAKCAHKPVKTSLSPTLDELLADHGERLRAAVDAARDLCLKTVQLEFGIPAS